MRFAMAAAIAFILIGDGAAASDDPRSCADYLTMSELDRGMMTGSVIHLWILKAEPDLDTGGSVISLAPLFRSMADEACKANPSAPAVDTIVELIHTTVKASEAFDVQE